MSGHPRTHQNAILRTYAGLLLISICVYTLMYAPQPMFNSVSRDFGVDKGSTGLLVSVFMLSLAVSPLCVGMLLSRIGVRRAILGASLLLGISGVGIWFAPSFLVLLGIRALQALLVPVVLTAVMSGIAVMFRHLDLNRALAGYVTSNLGRFAVRPNYRRLGCADVRVACHARRYLFFLFPCPPLHPKHSGNAQRQCAPPQPT